MVLHLEMDVVLIARNSNYRVAAARVPVNIGKRLLQNPEYRNLDFSG
jgi:hypothetical protein